MSEQNVVPFSLVDDEILIRYVNIHSLLTMNVCTKFNGNRSNSRSHSVWAKVLDQSAGQQTNVDKPRTACH